jgi:hypothetical protein
MEENVLRTPVLTGVQKSIYPVAKPSQLSALSRWTLTFRQRAPTAGTKTLLYLTLQLTRVPALWLTFRRNSGRRHPPVEPR